MLSGGGQRRQYHPERDSNTQSQHLIGYVDCLPRLLVEEERAEHDGSDTSGGDSDTVRPPTARIMGEVPATFNTGTQQAPRFVPSPIQGLFGNPLLVYPAGDFSIKIFITCVAS